MFVKGQNGGSLRNVNCRKWTVNYMTILSALLFCYVCVFSGPYVKKKCSNTHYLYAYCKKVYRVFTITLR